MNTVGAPPRKKRNRKKVVPMPVTDGQQAESEQLDQTEREKVRLGAARLASSLAGTEPAEPDAEPTQQEPDAIEEPAIEDVEDPYQEAHAGRPKTGESRSPSVRFFDRWNATPNFEENAEYWLFRIEPFTDRDAQGKPRFIQLYHQPCDESRIMDQFGSGVYKVMVKTREGDGPLQLRQTLPRLEIDNPDFPPRIEPGDWMEHHKNKRWAWAKKYYDADAAKAAGAGAATQGMSAADILTVVRETLEARLPASTGPKESVLDAVKIGLDMAKAAAPPPSNNDAVIQIMRDQMTALRAENAQMTQRFLDLLTKQATASAAAQPKTFTEQLQEAKAVIEQIAGLQPEGGGNRKAAEPHPGWDLLGDVLRPIAQAGAPVVQMLLTKALTEPKPRPQTSVIQQQQSGQQQQPVPAAGQPAAAVQEQAQTAGETTVDVPLVLKQHSFSALDWCFQRRATGDEWADWVESGWPGTIRALRVIGAEKGVMPVDEIIRIAKSVPLLWNQISPLKDGEERLRQFLAEVITWEPPEEQPVPQED
jgi:hypothetical protein